MSVTAKLRHLRIAPRKVRLVADLIRGKSASEAETILSFQTKRASYPIAKLLKSALANAKNNLKLKEGNFYISKITVDGGPSLKRSRPRARGRAYPILKRTSHITLVLDEKDEKTVKAKPKFFAKTKTLDIKQKLKTKVKKDKKSVKHGS